MRGSGLFAPGALDPHVERIERLRADYEWRPDALVSSHNDPNPGNILFDGQRPWLIDWESAYANDPLVDIAILLDGQTTSPEQEIAFLSAWLGRPPDPALRARLETVRAFTRLYYACFLLLAASTEPDAPSDLDAVAPSTSGLLALVREDGFFPASRNVAFALGQTYHAGVLTGDPLWELRQAVSALPG